MIPTAESLRVADAMRVLADARADLKAELSAKNYRSASVITLPAAIGIWTPGTGANSFDTYDEALSYIESLPLANWTPEQIEATLGVGPSSPPNPFLEGERNRDTQS